MPPDYKPHQSVTFPEYTDSFCNASSRLYSRIDNTAYLRTHSRGDVARCYLAYPAPKRMVHIEVI